MTPIKYTSQWCNLPHFLISCVRDKKVQYAVVPNGAQAINGHVLGSKNDCLYWLKRNGFVKSV